MSVTEIENNTSQEKIFEAVDILEQLCRTRNYKGSRSGVLNLTPRATFITEVLDYLKLDYELESFSREQEAEYKVLIFQEVFRAIEKLPSADREKTTFDMTEEGGKYNFNFDVNDLQVQGVIKDTVPTYHNIVVKFEANDPTEESILFTAHHDIANPNSDNCQDNSASVVNLLDLARKLKQEQPELNKNVYIIFLDCEETGGRGASHNAEKIEEGKYGDVKFIANSELTAIGDTLWVEGIDNALCDPYMKIAKEYDDNIVEKRCPPNDAMYYRSSGIPQAVCFGILPSEEAHVGFPDAWSVCHSSSDIFRADSDDMGKYVNFLYNFIND